MAGHNQRTSKSADSVKANVMKHKDTKTKVTRMTPSIRWAVEQFIRSSVAAAIHQNSCVGEPGMPMWDDALFDHLVKKTNSNITQPDVTRWIKTHRWIRDVHHAEEREQRHLFIGPLPPIPSPILPMDPPPLPITPASPPPHLPVLATASTSASASSPTPDHIKSKLEQLTKILPAFREMGQIFETTQELRIQKIPFGHMSRAITKYMEKLMVGKPYEELHGEQLHHIKMEMAITQLTEREEKFRPNFGDGLTRQQGGANYDDHLDGNVGNVSENEEITID